jgi:putative ABC transport system permease protein
MEIPALLSSMWRSKTGPLLVAAQVALALAVLVNVAYVIEQKVESISMPSGLDLGNMFWLTTQSTSHDFDTAAQAAAVKADLAWLNAIPGVVAAATAMPLPQGWGGLGLPFSADPAELAKPGGGHGAGIYMGSGRFIDAMGLKLVAGRDFSPGAVQPPAQDWQTALGAWAPEMILTRTMAHELFPNGNALGRTVYAGLVNKPAVVVGIVDVMRGRPTPPQFDQLAQQIVIVPIVAAGSNDAYVVRAAPGRRAELMRKVEKELGDLQPNRFISRIEAYDVTASRVRASYRASIIILAVVAVLVLAVTVVGIVGLAAYNVASRTRQLGTRRAIGARRFHIVRYLLI